MDGMSAQYASPASTNASRASVGRRAVTLTILLSIFATNFMDRQIVAILIEPIKHDMILSDAEVGLLYGFAFAVLYTTVGIPIARLPTAGTGHGSSTGRSCFSVP
jgi:hypothetical protein